MSKTQETVEFLSNHEVWRDIQGYEGLYQVSSFGRVRGMDRVVICKNGMQKTVKGRVLKQAENRHGYLEVSLSKRRHYTGFRVHRLVAAAFLDRQDYQDRVNHKDENKQNNNIANLEWCDAKYNANYGTCQQRRVQHTDFVTMMANLNTPERQRKRAISKSKVVNVYDASSMKYLFSGTFAELSKTLDMPKNTIRDYANGRIKNDNYSYFFKYSTDDTLSTSQLIKVKSELINTSKIREDRRIVVYHPVNYTLSVCDNVAEVQQKFQLRKTQLYTALTKSAGGAGEYIAVYKTPNFIDELRERYVHFRYKPIAVYDENDNYLFTNNRAEVAKYFGITRQYLTNVMSGDVHIIRGYRLITAIFKPKNISEVC